MVSWTKSSTSSSNCGEFTPAEEVGALECSVPMSYMVDVGLFCNRMVYTVV